MYNNWCRDNVRGVRDSFYEVVGSIFQVVAVHLYFHFYAASFVALTFAIKKIDISVAYAIWSGVGTALIALVGILYFKEAATMLKFASIFLIIAGVAGLRIGSSTTSIPFVSLRAVVCASSHSMPRGYGRDTLNLRLLRDVSTEMCVFVVVRSTCAGGT